MSDDQFCMGEQGKARQGMCCAVMCCLGLGCHVAVVGGLTDTALFDAEIEHALLLNAPSELPNHGRRRAQRWHSNQCSAMAKCQVVRRTRAGRRQEKFLQGRQRWAASVTASKNGRYLAYHATTRCIHLCQRRAMPFGCHHAMQREVRCRTRPASSATHHPLGQGSLGAACDN